MAIVSNISVSGQNIEPFALDDIISESGPSAKFLAPAKRRLVTGVLQTPVSHLEFLAF